MANHTAKPRKKPGPKSGYDPVFHPDRAYKLAVLGCTDAEIAEQFGISEKQLNEWKKKHKPLGESIHAGKRPANSEVADALRQRAKGFEWVEEVPTKIKVVDYDPTTGKKLREREEVVISLVKRRVPPDTMAASLFLRNREKENWRDKVEIDHSGKIETDMDDAKIDARLALLLGKAGVAGTAGGKGTPEE